MNIDERLAEFRSAIEDEIARARTEAVADLVRAAQRVRAALSEAELTLIFEDFAKQPAALAFLKTLAPASIPREENHLRAVRFARVRVAEIQLYHAAAMKNGRTSRDVYAALKTEMDAAREAYREKFITPANGTADYLHAEFVRTLANDDASLLGPTYPGPLV